MKICIKCNLTKDKNLFPINKNQCKNCISERNKKSCKKYYNSHKKQVKEYNEKNKILIALKIKKRKEANRDRYNKNKREYERNRKIYDPAYRLKTNMSKLININLKRNGVSKNGNSYIKYINYTVDQLKQHLENQFELWMNWDNYGLYDPNRRTWQVDHIKPHSEFKYTSMTDEVFKECWALNNLRPLESKQNAIDGGTRIRHSNTNLVSNY